MQQAEVNGEAAAVAAIAPHHPPLPMLIRDRPPDWFALIEFQLTIRKITKPVDKFSAIVIPCQQMSKPIWPTFSAKSLSCLIPSKQSKIAFAILSFDRNLISAMRSFTTHPWVPISLQPYWTK